MEVEVEELDALKRKLNIQIPKDVVSTRIKKAYKDLNQQISMPGFRPGKIPMHILEKKVPVESFSNMFQELMQDYYEKALEKTGILPAGAPEIIDEDIKEIKKDAPFNFSVTLHIKPNIQLGDYKGLKMEKKEAVVLESEVEMICMKLLESHGHFETYDENRAVEKGDFVVMDFEGFLKGEPLENGTAKAYELRVGEKKMITGFEDQIVGHKADEDFEVKVQLPQDWNNKMRRVSMPVPGVENDEDMDIADFKVRIKEIKKLVVPELNDAIAQAEGVDTVDELKRQIKINQQSYKEQQQEMQVKNDIFDKLVAESDFKPPESLIDREIKFILEGVKFQIEQSGMSLEDSGFDEERAKKEWREKAEKDTKGYMILEEIANEERIHVSESDMENEYKALAEQTKQKPEEVKQRMMAVPDSHAYTKSKLRGQKVLNFLYSNCEFEYLKDDSADHVEMVGE